jgi:hypothetical protein
MHVLVFVLFLLTSLLAVPAGPAAVRRKWLFRCRCIREASTLERRRGLVLPLLTIACGCGARGMGIIVLIAVLPTLVVVANVHQSPQAPRPPRLAPLVVSPPLDLSARDEYETLTATLEEDIHRMHRLKREAESLAAPIDAAIVRAAAFDAEAHWGEARNELQAADQSWRELDATTQQLRAATDKVTRSSNNISRLQSGIETLDAMVMADMQRFADNIEHAAAALRAIDTQYMAPMVGLQVSIDSSRSIMVWSTAVLLTAWAAWSGVIVLVATKSRNMGIHATGDGFVMLRSRKHLRAAHPPGWVGSVWFGSGPSKILGRSAVPACMLMVIAAVGLSVLAANWLTHGIVRDRLLSARDTRDGLVRSYDASLRYAQDYLNAVEAAAPLHVERTHALRLRVQAIVTSVSQVRETGTPPSPSAVMRKRIDEAWDSSFRLAAEWLSSERARIVSTLEGRATDGGPAGSDGDSVEELVSLFAAMMEDEFFGDLLESPWIRRAPKVRVFVIPDLINPAEGRLMLRLPSGAIVDAGVIRVNPQP